MTNESPVFRSIGISRLRIVNDGAGVTTLVAGFGCPLRCRYCLNPQCFETKGPVRTYGLSELLDEVKIDDLYFQATGGGIVFGGGEPLLQADFIHAFRKICPPEWKIGLESSLSTPPDLLEKVISDIDYYIIDVKDMNPEIYRAYTGMQNTNTVLNLKILISRVDPSNITIRLPLIPEYNTDEDRLQSRKTLEEMGFTTFDEFRYNVEIAETKKESIVCRRKELPTE